MRLDVGDVYTVVHTSDPRVLAAIRLVCRARPTGFQYMPRYRSGRWDGYISLMRGVRRFPTGLLSVVLDQLIDKGYTYELVEHDHQQPCPVVADILDGVILRDYQIDACNALLNARRGVAKMATNSGKTEVMAAMMKALGMPTVVITHRKELLYQTAGRFRARGLQDVGTIGDGIWDPRHTTVAMVQTLSGVCSVDKDRLPIYPGLDVVMIDECHHVSSPQMMDVLFSIPGAWRFGFSGTPLKHDVLSDMRLIAATGPVVVDISNRDLISAGYSVRPIVHLHVIESDEHYDSYAEVYDNLIVHNEARNGIIVSKALEHVVDSIVLVLVNQIEHGNILSDATGGLFVHGSVSSTARMATLNIMRKGVPGVYVASTIFDEGIDVPSVDVLILAGGGKSDIALLQRLGRGMRTSDGKNCLVVHDFIDDTDDHLLQHSEARLNVYETEHFRTILC